MSDWDEPLEEDGLTLGPEEALQREIEKSKSLKVDRLRLRDEIEKLKFEKADLAQKQQQLKERLAALENNSVGSSEAPLPPSRKIMVFALIFSILTLLFFMARN
ncbi:MAG: hypothetical protein HOH38_08180 [Nitrospinaceae bacterium]|mgnify:CR=1 FL=1|jgi:hypothetical protein|nr:hypothetical protein [Nitrospinaceae bacterium]